MVSSVKGSVLTEKNLMLSLLLPLLNGFVTVAILAVTKFCVTEYNIDSGEAVFVRMLGAFILFLPGIISAVPKTYKTFPYRLLVPRSIASGLAMILWAKSYSRIPLHIAMTVSFIVPVISTILAGIFLKERPAWNRYAVMAVSLLGVFLSLDGSSEAVNWYYYGMACFCTLLWSSSNVLSKSLTQVATPQVIMAYNLLLSTGFVLVFTAPSVTERILLCWPALLLLPFLTLAGHFLNLKTYQLCDVSLTQALDFIRLPYVMLIDVILFGESLTMMSIIASGIVIASTTYLVASEHRKSTLKGTK